MSCVAAIIRLCAALAVMCSLAGQSMADCALFAEDEAALAADTIELRDAQLAPRFAGVGAGPRPDSFCADVAFDVDSALHGRYQRTDTPTAMNERVSVTSDQPVLGGVRTTTVAARRMPAGRETETTLAQTVAAARGEVTGSWARSGVEDRFGVQVREDWLSGPNMSLSARHGLTALRERGTGRLRLIGLSSRIQAVRNGWRLSLRRVGPVPIGRTDTHEIEFGFPETPAALVPRATGLRGDRSSGELTGVAAWVEWAMYDTDLGLHAARADRENWSLAFNWRFDDPLLGAMEINAGMQLDPDGTERRIALASAFSW